MVITVQQKVYRTGVQKKHADKYNLSAASKPIFGNQQLPKIKCFKSKRIHG